MKKARKFMESPKGAAVVFGTAAALLAFSTIGGARAAVLYGIQNYPATIRTSAVSVGLVEENAGTEERKIEGTDTGAAALLEGMVPAGEKVSPGKRYEEILSVENTGETEEYVRVTVYRYWKRTETVGGESVTEKDRTVSPGYIKLDFREEGWEIDPAASTEERTVLYYRYPLKAGERVPFVEGLAIDSAVGEIREKGPEGETSYRYGDLAFEVKVSVDAVQTHHAEEAVLSAWGRAVSVDESGMLTLKESGETEDAGTAQAGDRETEGNETEGGGI